MSWSWNGFEPLECIALGRFTTRQSAVSSQSRNALALNHSSAGRGRASGRAYTAAMSARRTSMPQLRRLPVMCVGTDVEAQVVEVQRRLVEDEVVDVA